MATFMTRVELKGSPSAKTYEDLHEAMKGAGFTRTIVGKNGTYHLSHAEYRFDDGQQDNPSAAIMGIARAAARTVQPNIEVTTVKYSEAAWDGLRGV